jgi:hypothetical protein
VSGDGVEWAEFAAAVPDMAAAGLRLLYQHGPGLAYLATVRKDGGPRVHPVCPHVAEGRLWLFVNPESPKYHDLRRDGRFALHTFPHPDVDDEFFVRGAVTWCADAGLAGRVRASLPFSTGDHDEPFTLAVERALLSTYGPRPSWPPRYTRWRSGATGSG